MRQNNLKKCEVQVFEGLQNLMWLDLRQNEFGSLKEILNGLKNNRDLKTLYLAESTKGKETKKPRNYINKVCTALRGVSTVDDLKNPFGVVSVGRKKLGAGQSISRRKRMEIQTESGDESHPQKKPKPELKMMEEDSATIAGGGEATSIVGSGVDWSKVYKPKEDEISNND